MAKVYEHKYLPMSMYGNVVALIQETTPDLGLHLDFGCGYGAIAEPVRDELGRCYLGFDLAEDGLASLRQRGFEAYTIDLGQLTDAETIVREAVKGRVISSLTLLDTLEHITNGPEVLAFLHQLANENSAPLILSVPNVSHKDIAIKLLMGRWDITETGLLDHTHVAFYNYDLLSRTTRSVGWSEVAAQDWLLEYSDQHFPPESTALNRRLPLAQFLRELAGSANPHALVNQFVRAYRPEDPDDRSTFTDRAGPTRSFLSVIMVADVARPDRLRKAIRSLERQTDDNFELIVLLLGCKNDIDLERENPVRTSRNWAKRLTVVPMGSAVTRADALNKIIDRVAGSYVAIIDDDVLEQRWVETFFNLSASAEGAVLQIDYEHSNGSDPRNHESDDTFDTALERIQPINLLTAPRHNRLSISNVALPVGVFCDLGLRFVGSSPAEINQDLVGRASIHCGAISCQMPAICRLQAQEHETPSCTPSHDPLGSNHGPILLPFEAAQEARDIAARSAGERVWLNRKLEETVGELRTLSLDHEQQASLLKSLRAWRGVIEGQPLLQALITQYIRPAEPVLELERSPSVVPDGPFLSVIARTQGRRIEPMRDMLMSLAGQSCDDFRLFVVLHRCEETQSVAVHSLVSEFPQSFRSRITILTCDRPGRSSPLNEALKHVQSEYVSVLDDDDFVFGHWVETFRGLSREAPPGSLLRAVSVRQSFDAIPTSQGSTLSWAHTWFSPIWPSSYDAIDHLCSNHTPFMSVAYPIAVFRDLGLRFDETVSTAEDWELTTRAAMLCGVASTPEVTAVYRWWTNGESSLFQHSREEWLDNYHRILRNLDSGPLLLPAGTASRLRDMRFELDAQRGRLAQMQQHIAELEAQRARLSQRNLVLGEQLLAAGLVLADPETSPTLEEFAYRRLAALVTSTSWRLTRPIRRLGALLRRRPSAELSIDCLPFGFNERQRAISAIVSSTSWHLTRPFRAISNVSGRLPAPYISAWKTFKADSHEQHMSRSEPHINYVGPG